MKIITGLAESSEEAAKRKKTWKKNCHSYVFWHEMNRLFD